MALSAPSSVPRSPEISVLFIDSTRDCNTPPPNLAHLASDRSFIANIRVFHAISRRPQASASPLWLGIYGLILPFRYLLPRNTIPLLSLLLNKTTQRLDSAEAVGAVPSQSEFRTHLDR